jgi:hypothetical protein
MDSGQSIICTDVLIVMTIGFSILTIDKTNYYGKLYGADDWVAVHSLIGLRHS